MTALDTPSPISRGGSKLGQGRGQSVFMERLVRNDGPTLEIVVARPNAPARGAPVLFVHGAFAGAWCWNETYLPAFAEDGRYAAAVSLRGHGNSEGHETVWSAGLADFVADLRLAIEAMPAPPILVAHSIGGLLAQLLLGQTVMRGLVLMGSLPPEGLALVGPWLAWSALGIGWSTILATAAESGQVRMPSCPDLIFGQGIEPANAQSYAALLGAGSLLTIAEAHVPRFVIPAFAVEAPVLVLNGSDDWLVDPLTALRTALYHGAEYRLVPQAGHFPMLGPAAVTGSNAVLEWLERRGL